MNLNGWQRLWVVLSSVYLLVVIAYGFVKFPRPETTVHKNEFYQNLPPKSKVMIANSGESQSTEEVTMPNGHLINFHKGIGQKEMEHVAGEYWSIVQKNTNEQSKRFLLYAFLAWLVPCCVSYALGWSMRWAYKGF